MGGEKLKKGLNLLTMHREDGAEGLPFFNKKRLPMLAVGLIVLIVVVILIGNAIVAEYRRGMGRNSASLLMEYGNQVTSSIDRTLNNDWNIASSVATTLNVTNITSLDGMLPTLKQLRSTWKVQNINVYTDSGYGVDADGKKINEEIASEQVYQAKTNGRYMTVVKSEIYLLLPVTTGVTLNGQPITAVAVVVDLEDLVNDLNITSFNNTAAVYLTQKNGLIISKNTDIKAINISVQFEDGELTVLSGDHSTISDAVASEDVTSYLYDDGASDRYVVVMPVSKTGENNWSIVFTAPTAEVDYSMNAFANFVTGLYIALVVVIVAVVVAAFYFIYKQRIKSLDEILTRERMLNLLISNTNNVFFLFAKNRKDPLFVSSNAAAILGEDNLPGIDTTSEKGTLQLLAGRFFHTQSVDELNADLRQWDGKSEYISDYIAMAVRGEERYFVMRLYPSEDIDADYILIFADLTIERERQEALKGALAMADDANKAKTLFLSNMSHDIRTPMNAIVNMTDFALQSTDDPKALSEYLNTIKASSAHLLRLINNVLDMSRIESGKTAIEIEPFTLTGQLQQIHEMMEPLCGNKHQKLDCRFQITNDELLGDSLKLRQILINLLNNASKFTPEGGTITFEALEERALDASHISCRFVVRDTGVGISKEDQERIFSPFTRLDNQLGSQAEGSGLGLSICKSFVEAMGGSIVLTSALGQGSTFEAILPFKRAKEESLPAGGDRPALPADRRFDGKSALLCEDNAINRTIAEVMLKNLGFTVTMAKDGQEGLRTFEASEPGTFDVVFMDIQMPIMNGYEATAAIRASRHPQAETIPIIAMTANVFKEDISRALSSGMNGHIGKPLSMDAIISTAADVLEIKEAKR